jgi:hypothetical protein
MGTNYYFTPPLAGPCEHCGRSDSAEELHIGKSSGGWCFALHIIPEKGINDLEDWVKLFPTGRIRDEYGQAVTAENMVREIAERSWSPKRTHVGDMRFHAANQSEDGPNGLLRHRLDGRYCTKHGAGTWDCMPGEFS